MVASGDGALKYERGDDSGPDLVTTRFKDPWTAERMELHDRAKAALDETVRAAVVPGLDTAAERVTRAMDGADGPIDVTELSRWTAAASDPAYLSAFSKLAVDPMNGHRSFTDAELKSFQRAETLKRAMSLTTGSGGYLVPFALMQTSSTRPMARTTWSAKRREKSLQQATSGTEFRAQELRRRGIRKRPK